MDEGVPTEELRIPDVVNDYPDFTSDPIVKRIATFRSRVQWAKDCEADILQMPHGDHTFRGQMACRKLAQEA